MTPTRSRRRLYQAGAALLAFVLACALVWHGYLKDRVIPKRFGVVDAGMVYRSGQMHPAIIKQVLSDNHIRVVVDLQYPEDKPAQEAERQAIGELGIEQYRFPLNGNGTGDIEQYARAIARIHRSVLDDKPVLVHCAAGAQRTGGVIAAWRTLVEGKSVTSAVHEMEQYDWDPVKDHVLLEYLDGHIETLARRLVELGVIPAVPPELPRFANEPSRSANP